MRILVVEDDVEIAMVIRRGLEKAQYRVDVASNGRRGLELATENRYALLILDIMLPEMDGWAVCERLRASRDRVPILMLTARDAVADRVRGLDMGADDYLPKPFDFAELLARVGALLRREKPLKTRTIKIADLEIDTGLHRVLRAGQEIMLTPREYDLLEALASREGQVLSREMIQEQVWMDDTSYSNTVDVYVNLLRRKIDAPFETKLIQTVHRLGYTLRDPQRAGTP